MNCHSLKNFLFRFLLFYCKSKVIILIMNSWTSLKRQDKNFFKWKIKKSKFHSRNTNNSVIWSIKAFIIIKVSIHCKKTVKCWKFLNLYLSVFQISLRKVDFLISFKEILMTKIYNLLIYSRNRKLRICLLKIQ